MRLLYKNGFGEKAKGAAGKLDDRLRSSLQAGDTWGRQATAWQ